MLVSCAVFALSAGASPWVAAGVLVAGAVLQVVAEMQQSAGSWQVGFDLAPADRMGEYQGFFGTGVTVARTAGPLVLTALLVGWGTPGWLLLGGLMLGASYGMGPAVRWAATREVTAHRRDRNQDRDQDRNQGQDQDRVRQQPVPVN
jgi:hypothetical protein